VSSTLIDYSDKSGTYQVSLKIFHDDLEKDLGFEMNELDYDDYEKTNSFIKEYLFNNFKIYSNESELKVDFLGFERKNDLVIYYIEIFNAENVKSLIVENKILFQSFRNQKNIILYRYNNYKKSFIHTSENFQSSISVP
tara:strand:+ start:69 stop:485 length:417 start_codon:yes stop_codon:yes gene_type:complete